MAYEFKKLGDVEALEEVPENANALIEVDGAIKRVPGSGLGGGGGTGLIVRIAYDDDFGGFLASASYKEFYDALNNGTPLIVYLHAAGGSIYYASKIVSENEIWIDGGRYEYWTEQSDYGIAEEVLEIPGS